MTKLPRWTALATVLLIQPQTALASIDWDCGGGGVSVWFESSGSEVGSIFSVTINGKTWSRYPGHEPPNYLPLRRQLTRPANTIILYTYTDKRTGEVVLEMRFDDVPSRSGMSDHGLLTIKDEGTWNVTCSNG